MKSGRSQSSDWCRGPRWGKDRATCEISNIHCSKLMIQYDRKRSQQTETTVSMRCHAHLADYGTLVIGWWEVGPLWQVRSGSLSGYGECLGLSCRSLWSWQWWGGGAYVRPLAPCAHVGGCWVGSSFHAPTSGFLMKMKKIRELYIVIHRYTFLQNSSAKYLNKI